MSNVVTMSTPVNNVNLEIDLWDAFWTLYPRHEAKKDALKAWSRLNESDRTAAVCAIADWRQVWRAQGRDTHLIPLAATWLNGERWEDEVPRGLVPRAKVAVAQVGATGSPGAGVRRPFESVSGPDHEAAASSPPLPEHVLAMLAKMKEKLR